MNEIPYLLLAALGGLLLGVLFFGGLWFTVKKAVTAKIPALWIFGSFLLRTGIAMAGFYFIGGGDWKKLIACLVGFIVARFVVYRFTKPLDVKQQLLKKEVLHGA